MSYPAPPPSGATPPGSPYPGSTPPGSPYPNSTPEGASYPGTPYQAAPPYGTAPQAMPPQVSSPYGAAPQVPEPTAHPYPGAPYAYPGAPHAAQQPRPLVKRPVAARVLLIIDLLLLLGALLLPMLQDTEGINKISVAEYGRPGLAPFGSDDGEATIAWWLVATFIAILVQAVAICLAFAKVLPTWLATVLGILGTFCLAGALVTVAVAALVASSEDFIEVGLAAPCLVLGQALFLVVMFAPSLVRGWKS